MRKLLWLLPLLAGCGQNTIEHQASKEPAPPQPQAIAQVPVAPVKPDTAYTSGDRETYGPLDTLHVGRGLVLRLVPGSKSDFPRLPRQVPVFSEARLIRQQGDGRVQRIGHTLLVRPYAGPVLRFTDNTPQIRHYEDEQSDVKCRFLGSIPGRPYWLTDSALYERSQPFLINKQSGHLTAMSWEPDISPNRKLLFVASPGLDSPATENTLQLWVISDQMAVPLWNRKLVSWQPQRVRWLDNHTIAVEQLRFDPNLDSAYVRLLLPR